MRNMVPTQPSVASFLPLSQIGAQYEVVEKSIDEPFWQSNVRGEVFLTTHTYVWSRLSEQMCWLRLVPASSSSSDFR